MKIIILTFLSYFFIQNSISQKVYYKKGKYGLEDSSGKVILKAKYDEIRDFTVINFDCNLTKTKKVVDDDDDWGFSLSDESISKLIKEWGLCNKYASIYLDGYYGLIDTLGREVVPLKYRRPIEFDYKGFAHIIVGDPIFKSFGTNYYGLLNKSFKEVIPPIFVNKIEYENFGYFKVQSGEKKFGLLDSNFKEAMAVKYYKIKIMAQNVIATKMAGDNKFVLQKNGGEIIGKYEYEEAYTFQENNLALVKRNGKYGFIDKTCKEIIDCKFEDVIGVFKDGVIKVKLNGKELYIDENGSEKK